ncbi:MAG: major coat protein [Plant associated closterovirus 2]|nr:MAG: major coat protein [Plant associated closterovirus 2]
MLRSEDEETVSANYSDDDGVIVSRAIGCKVNHDYNLRLRDREEVTMSIPYSSELRTKPINIEVYFHIGKGYVIYFCRPSNNFNQSVKESNLGTFFSSYRDLSTPRRPRGSNSFRFGYVRTGGECYIKVEGWRIVEIPNASSISAITLRISLDIEDVPFKEGDVLTSNFLDIKSCLNVDTPEDLISDVKPANLFLYSDSTRKSVQLKSKNPLPLREITGARALNIIGDIDGNSESSKEVFNEFDKTLETMSSSEDTKKIFRIYYSNFLNGSFQKNFSYSIFWPIIEADGLDVNHQFWLGDRDNMFEGGMQYYHIDRRMLLFFLHRSNDVSRYYKVDKDVTVNVFKGIPKVLDVNIEKSENSTFNVYISGIKCVTAKLPNVTNKVQLGWELKLYRAKIKTFNSSKLMSFDTIPHEKFVKTDGVETSLKRFEFKPTVNDASGWNLPRKTGFKLRTVTDVNQFFSVPTEKDPDDDKTKTSEATEVEVGKKIDDISFDDKKVAQEEKLSESGIKAIIYQPFSSQEDTRIFNSMVKWYVEKGLTAKQAELVIYQMGISFCTSVNSCANTNLSLIATKSDGSLLRFTKADHVTRLQLLTNKYCNVERTLLRNRSDIIFKLLKARVLVPPVRHAKTRGLKADMAHMACDFMDYASIPLSDEEILALSTVQRFVAMKNKHRRSIVNVNQLL